jgi:hypothetical protein
MSWLRLMEESIKENESATVAVETKTDPSAVSPQRHRVAALIKDMWPAYLIEIFVIILGISISLALEQWRDNNKENRLENIYLKNLLTDVEVDLQSLKYVKDGTEKILYFGNELLGYARNSGTQDISFNRADSDIRAILGRPKFFSSDATFSDLTSSGNLHLLKNIQLKNLLFSYYRQTQNIKELQDAEQQATIMLSGSYFLKRFSMDDKSGIQPKTSPDDMNDLLKNVEFVNNVLLRFNTRAELLELYKSAESIALLLRDGLVNETSPH